MADQQASKLPVPALLETAYTSKKAKKIKTFEEKEENRKKNNKVRFGSRVYIGAAFPKWRELREKNHYKTDAELAFFLLDWFSTSHQVDGSVDKEYTCAVPHNRKTSPSVHSQDEERRTHFPLNDDVWVNLSCLLQLFLECGRCRGICAVHAQEDRSHFFVVQHCKACNHWDIWNSQPLKSTSTENGENTEDLQIPEVSVSSPRDDRRGRQTVTTGPEVETEVWKEEHPVEVEVSIDSDCSDELPSCRLEERGREEELGQQLDEVHENDDGQIAKHHKDIKETETRIAESVGRTVEVNRENSKEGLDKVTEDDEWQREEEDWSEEQQEGESQESDPDLEISQSIKRPVTRKKKYFVKRYPQRLCPICGIMYTRETHKCGNKRIFPCPKCGKLCASEHNLNAHRIHCERYVFPCRLCLEPFKTKLDKVNHENGHQETEKPYSCSKCPEMFDDFYTRNRHFKEHRVLTCRTCHKQFQRPYHLRRHEVSHVEYKPFKCQVCECAFSQCCHLKCHMRVHTGEQPWKCHLCPMRFRYKVGLKTHIRRYHQSPRSHPDSGEQRVTPRGPSPALASDPRGQEESLEPNQEAQPSRGSTKEGELHNMTVQERGKGEVAECVPEDQGGVTLQTKLEITEREGGGNAYESRPKRKRQRNRWLDFEWEGAGQKDS